MRKILTFSLFILCTFLLQSTWPVVIRIGYVPDMLLILVVSMAFMRGRRSGMLFGMICGILADLCYMPFLGFSALLFTLTGYLAGGTFDVFFSENVKLPMVMAAAGEFVYRLTYYLVFSLKHGRQSFFPSLIGTMLPQAVLTMLLTIPLYGVFYFFNRKIAVHGLEEQQSPWLRK